MKKLLTAIAALIVLALIAYGIFSWLGGKTPGPGPTPPPTTSPKAGPPQPTWCPKIEVVAVPGSWESSKNDDPFNPTANPRSFMLTVTKPLQQKFGWGSKVSVWTLPYTAEFRNIRSLGEMSYDDSRQEGMDRLAAHLAGAHAACPLTKFALMGFSQGAVIAGDTAAAIGQGVGPIPADSVSGVALIADGRRQPAVGQFAGTPIGGVGAEISLEPLNSAIGLILPGATMTGPRPGGFGALDSRVTEICAPGDHICDAPVDVGDALTRAGQLIENNGVHAQYATNMAVFGTETTTDWLIRWATNLIDTTPDPTAGYPQTAPPAGAGQ